MAHGFLSYQDPRGEVDYLDKIYKAIKGYLDKRDKREEKAERKGGLVKSPDPFDDGGPVEPAEIAVDSPKSPPANPLKRALAGSALRRALPSAAATPTEVRGGALARSMGFAGNRVKPEGFVADQIIDVTAVPVNDSAEIVAAIDRLTFVSMNLLSAQKEQNAIAQRQQLFFEKLARKDKASSEERLLEQGKDLSSNIAYKKSSLQSGTKLLPPSGGTGGSRNALQSVASSLVKRSPQALKAGAGLAAKGGLMTVKQAGNIRGTLQAARIGSGITKRISQAALDKTIATGGPRAIARARQAQIDATPVNTIRKAPKRVNNDAARALENLTGGSSSKIQAAKYKKLRSQGLSDTAALQRAFPEMAQEIAEVGKTAGTSTAMTAVAGDTVPTAVRQSDDVIKASLSAADGPLAKMLGKGLGKSLLKKIPVIAGVAGIVFGIQRALEGDFLGAGLEITSGILGATGVGGLLGAGIDGYLLARDFGMTPFAQGGIITQPTTGLVGEAGTEGVFPLEGTRGKKTFEMFGNAFIDAQKRRKKEVAQIQAEGFKLFSEDAQYMKVFDLFNPFKWGRDPENPEQPNNGGREWWDFLGWAGTGQNPEVQPQRRMVGPPPAVTGTGDLFDVIASGEGGYESINRGVAGDTPGGAESVFGKKLSDMTVGEVMELQAQDKLFAVGKYQIIPKTMKGFVRTMKISLDDKFDSTTQEKFKKYVTDFKRPAVGRYLRGESNNRSEAAQELAREFASIGLAYDEAGRVRGESRYSGTAGNAASISPAEIEAALDRGRNGINPLGDQSMLPGAPETGNPLSIASQQVANAGLATQTPTIINNYYGGGSQTGGNMPADVAFGVSSGDMGNSWASELRLRTV